MERLRRLRRQIKVDRRTNMDRRRTKALRKVNR